MAQVGRARGLRRPSRERCNNPPCAAGRATQWPQRSPGPPVLRPRAVVRGPQPGSAGIAAGIRGFRTRRSAGAVLYSAPLNPLGAPMSDEDFNDSPDLELEDDLVEDDDPLDDDLVVEADVEADDVDLLDDDLELSPEVPVAVVTDDAATETEDEEDEGVVDLEEELHPDDVEEPLDVLLQERTA